MIIGNRNFTLCHFKIKKGKKMDILAAISIVCLFVTAFGFSSCYLFGWKKFKKKR